LYHALGDYGRAVELLRENADSLPADQVHRRLGGTGIAAATSRTWLAWSLAELGQFAEALTRAEEAVHIAQLAAHPFTLVIAEWGVGHIYLSSGKPAEAISRLAPIVEATRLQAPAWLPLVAASLGLARVQAGHALEGLALLEEGVEYSRATGHFMYQPARMVWLSEAYRTIARHDDALASAEQGLALARRQNERGAEACALRPLGEIAAYAHPPNVAE